MVSFDILYNAFFSKIEKNASFFVHNNLSDDECIDLIKSQAKNFLNEAASKFKLNDLDIDLNLDMDTETITPDLTQVEIDILSSLMFEVYLSRDIANLGAMTKYLTSTDLKLLGSPANERKTYMEMYNSVKYSNEVMIDRYIKRDRLTGKVKTLAY